MCNDIVTTSLNMIIGFTYLRDMSELAAIHYDEFSHISLIIQVVIMALCQILQVCYVGCDRARFLG